MSLITVTLTLIFSCHVPTIEIMMVPLRLIIYYLDVLIEVNSLTPSDCPSTIAGPQTGVDVNVVFSRDAAPNE